MLSTINNSIAPAKKTAIDILNLMNWSAPLGHPTEGYVTYAFHLTSPNEAKSLLALSRENNRSINKQNVKRLAADMEEGMFEGLANEVHISDTNTILNGHHRLYAIIAADVPVFIKFCRGLSDDTFQYFDNGLNRSGANMIEISGIETGNARALNSVAKSTLMYQKDIIGGNGNFTTREVLETAKLNLSGINAAIDWVTNNKMNRHYGTAGAVLVHGVFMCMSGALKHKWKDFSAVWIECTDKQFLSPENPPQALHNFLTKFKRTKIGNANDSHFQRVARTRAATAAFQAFVYNRKISEKEIMFIIQSWIEMGNFPNAKKLARPGSSVVI